MFPDINITYWPGLARVVMRGWNPTLVWTWDNICHLRPDSLTSSWHHLDITCTVWRQNRDSPSQGVTILPPSPGPGLRWLFYYKHFYRWYNQTEDCNYPYFVFLLNLWSRKFLICLKHDQQSEEGRVQTRSSSDLLSQEGPVPVLLQANVTLLSC